MLCCALKNKQIYIFSKHFKTFGVHKNLSPLKAYAWAEGVIIS
jgi:hypothetical protein